jgi:hypothetical protein
MDPSEDPPKFAEGSFELLDFREQVYDDLENGTAKPLRAYLARFPGLEEEVAREFFLIQRERNPSPGGEAPRNEQIGPYEILSLLGSGGQGSVHLAIDSRTHDYVALKVLHRFVAPDDPLLRRFLRGAEILGKLVHPSICSVRDAGHANGNAFIAMDYIQGRSLAQVIDDARSGAGSKAATPVSPARQRTILSAVASVAEALELAHTCGIIHRDVKPGNLLMGTDGRCVLVDFGMARIEDSQLSRSQSAVMQGTPAYMSPEQIRMGSVPVDARTDVYSLGVTLFEWLTGTQPFVSATREGLLRAIAETPLPNLRSHLPSPSRDLELVIGKATEKDPTDRYQTAGEFAEDLRRILKREPVRARGAGALLQARRFVARRPLLATALAIGVFALLLITYLWTRADRALDEYDLVARTHSISQLLVDAENLWPLDARRINDLQAWLSRVDAVAPELAVLEQRLASIRGTMVLRRAEDTPPHMRAEEAKIVGPDGGSVNLLRRDTWLATDLRKQFRHDTLEQAVEGLRAIVGKGERGGLRAEVADRLRFLETVEARSVTALDEIWKQTISDIADVSKNPAYGGLRILPQIGLIPIGKDETSNLFEFMDLYTTEKSVLDVTKIRESGQPIAASPELGTIFVLLPGGTFAMGSVNSKEAQSSPNDPIDSEAEYAETPTTMVTLDAFFLSKFELTQAQWPRMPIRS